MELQRLRGLANLEDGIDARMFPHLFPQGRRGDGWTAGPFAAYARGRLLGADPRFQQSQEYVFWLLETWLKREVSAQTTLFVAPRLAGPGPSRAAARDRLRKQVFAVLRGVPGTSAHMYAKRSLAMRMIAQLGPPTWFVTLTGHERQPRLLLACIVAHFRAQLPSRWAPL
ncbi:MAG: hypothetical protein GY772_17360, partial [bacterium]|nr:hypothetical protein [bacterium]